jgi:hypothetical protein
MTSNTNALRRASALVLLFGPGLIGGRAVGQPTQPPASTPVPKSVVSYVPPPTKDGQPDIQGFWQINGIGIAALEPGGYRPPGGVDVAFGDARPQAPGRPKLPAGIIDPPGGKLPLLPAAAARMKEQGAFNLDPAPGQIDKLDPMARCLPAGVPRFYYSTGYNGYQFLQNATYIIMLGEWNHHHRLIPLDGRPKLRPPLKLWMGDARARWEGTTLVVETTNFQGENWLDMVGAYHTDALHVVERFRIVDADTIAYEARITDPNVYSQPWTLAGWFNRAAKGYRLFEYACQEGNKFLQFHHARP